MVCSCAMPAANDILFMRKGNRAFLLLRQIIDLLATDKSRYFLMLRHVQWLLIIVIVIDIIIIVIIVVVVVDDDTYYWVSLSAHHSFQV